jgi:hypothetical protein
VTGLPFLPPPPPITTPAERRRWNLCVDAATACSECCEPTGVADPMFVAFAARGLYDSDIPTADAPTADRWGVRRSSEALPIDYPGAGTVIDSPDV